MPSLFSWLTSSISLPAMVSGPQALLFAVPLVRLLETRGTRTRDKSPITFNGVPLQVVLARLNAKRNLPAAGRRALKEGRRAKAKAMARQTASESHKEQQAYEAGFMRHKRWNWRQVERELCKRNWSFAQVALLAAEVGVSIAVAGEALTKVAA